MFHVDTVLDVSHFLLWNLSSASIDLVNFIFLPPNSLFNIFADLMNLFLPPSFLKWMNARVIGFAGHSILAFLLKENDTDGRMAI